MEVKMKKVVVSLFAKTLVALLAPTICCSNVFAQLTGGTQKAFLQAGIEHSERMGPVSKSLKVGTVFDEAKLEKLAPMKIWYRVPPWLAGKWQHEDENQTSYLDFKTGVTDTQIYHFQNHGIESFGYQRDKLGGIWDYIDLPFITEETSDKELDKDRHTDDSIIFDSDARVIVRYVYTRSELDKHTKVIRGVYQAEEFRTLFPYGPDMFRSETSQKKFDDRGNPVYLSKCWRIGKRIAPFKLSSYDSSFGEYLKANGLDNLVPLQQ